MDFQNLSEEEKWQEAARIQDLLESGEPISAEEMEFLDLMTQLALAEEAEEEEAAWEEAARIQEKQERGESLTLEEEAFLEMMTQKVLDQQREEAEAAKWAEANRIHSKMENGEQLTDEESAFLEAVTQEVLEEEKKKQWEAALQEREQSFLDNPELKDNTEKNEAIAKLAMHEVDKINEEAWVKFQEEHVEQFDDARKRLSMKQAKGGGILKSTANLQRVRMGDGRVSLRIIKRKERKRVIGFALSDDQEEKTNQKEKEEADVFEKIGLDFESVSEARKREEKERLEREEAERKRKEEEERKRQEEFRMKRKESKLRKAAVARRKCLLHHEKKDTSEEDLTNYVPPVVKPGGIHSSKNSVIVTRTRLQKSTSEEPINFKEGKKKEKKKGPSPPPRPKKSNKPKLSPQTNTPPPVAPRQGPASPVNTKPNGAPPGNTKPAQGPPPVRNTKPKKGSPPPVPGNGAPPPSGTYGGPDRRNSDMGPPRNPHPALSHTTGSGPINNRSPPTGRTASPREASRTPGRGPPPGAGPRGPGRTPPMRQQPSPPNPSRFDNSAPPLRSPRNTPGGSYPQHVMAVFVDFDSTFRRDELKKFWELFENFDDDSDGYLNFFELKVTLEKLDVPKTHTELKQIMQEVATDQNKGISFRDFCIMQAKVKKKPLPPGVRGGSGTLSLLTVNFVDKVTDFSVGGIKAFHEAKAKEFEDLMENERRIKETRELAKKRREDIRKLKEQEERERREAEEAQRIKRAEFKNKYALFGS